jgi:glucose-6-phosphate 1-dehydrogenase
MDPPYAFQADALRNEKVKALSAVRRLGLRDVRDNLVIGQYDGYHYEPGVSPGSHTPTYAALRLFVDNWRWHGVPFYLRSGKGLSRKTTEMIVQFRSPPHMLFPVPDDVNIPGNTLSICVQPNEGMRLEFQSKVPDAGLEMAPVSLEFHYHDDFAGIDIPDAYERLLLDVVAGDASLFTRSDEIELAWSIIDPIVHGLDLPGAPAPYRYLPGMDGPPNGQELLATDNRHWLPGCVEVGYGI